MYDVKAKKHQHTLTHCIHMHAYTIIYSYKTCFFQLLSTNSIQSFDQPGAIVEDNNTKSKIES